MKVIRKASSGCDNYHWNLEEWEMASWKQTILREICKGLLKVYFPQWENLKASIFFAITDHPFKTIRRNFFQNVMNLWNTSVYKNTSVREILRFESWMIAFRVEIARSILGLWGSRAQKVDLQLQTNRLCSWWKIEQALGTKQPTTIFISYFLHVGKIYFHWFLK